MITIPRISRPFYKVKIGNREVVGPGFHAVEDYIDRVDFPCPPCRFKPPSEEFDALREKEKGSWKALSIDEKKKLYRFSFCQTLKEVEAPNFSTRRILGGVLFLMSIPIVGYTIMRKTIFPPLPDTFSDQNKKQIVRFYIESRADMLDGGISSKWDYEKNEWKEKPYLLMKNK